MKMWEVWSGNALVQVQARQTCGINAMPEAVHRCVAAVGRSWRPPASAPGAGLPGSLAADAPCGSEWPTSAALDRGGNADKEARIESLRGRRGRATIRATLGMGCGEACGGAWASRPQREAERREGGDAICTLARAGTVRRGRTGAAAARSAVGTSHELAHLSCAPPSTLGDAEGHSVRRAPCAKAQWCAPRRCRLPLAAGVGGRPTSTSGAKPAASPMVDRWRIPAVAKLCCSLCGRLLN